MPPSSSSPHHRVFRVEYTLALPDPDVPHTEYHTVLFAETDRSTGAGTIFHVGGDITSPSGMHYQSKPGKRPEDSETYHGKRLLGVTVGLEGWDGLLREVKRPPQQKAFNVRTRRTEPVKSLQPLMFYEQGEERRPMSKCAEWVDQEAIPALINSGLLKTSEENEYDKVLGVKRDLS